MINWEYAPAPESSAIAAIKDRYLPYVDGVFVEGGGDDLDAINPGTGEKLTTVSTVDDNDLDRAVKAARKAYEGVWSSLSGAERGKYLFRIARGIAERSRELAVVETLDNGKPIKETRDFDVPNAAQHFFYHAGWADKLQHLGLGPAPRPLGVAGQVIPWNFPLLMAAWKIAPALAAGNTVVIKPAETTSVSILVLAEIIADADLPPGVVNIVPGAGEVGRSLVNHPGLDKVAFTGSTAVGRQIGTSLAGTGRKITLELGGKGANIVFDDAAQDQAIEGIVNGIFFNQGQVCCAGSRLLVQESIAEEFVERLKDRVETLAGGRSAGQEHRRRGDQLGRAAGADHHPPRRRRGRGRRGVDLVLPAAEERLLPLPHDLHQRDAVDADRPGRDLRARCSAVMTFRTPDEALSKANNSAYGLSAGVWTEKGSRAMGMAAGLRAGVIWDNTFNKFDPTASFGGYKESGYGREGGPSGMAAYLDSSTRCAS